VVLTTAVPPKREVPMTSASLPFLRTIVKAEPFPLGVGSPKEAPKQTLDEEVKRLRARNRALEHEIRRANEALFMEREAASAYAKQELERQTVVWKRAQETWEQEKAAQIAEMACEVEGKLLSYQRDHSKQLANRESDLELLSATRVEEITKEFEARAAAQEAKDKEARVELLRRQVARRILNSDLTRGWSAWAEHWEARTYAIHRLHECANRLRRPGTALAFKYLLRNRDETRRVAELSDTLKREAAVLAVHADLEAEIVRLRENFEARLAMAEEAKRGALEKQRLELLGTADDQLQLREQKEREARIELLRRQIGRRLLSRDLARGWSAWCEMWAARSYAIKRLREASQRLKSPQMAIAYQLWVGAWRVTKLRRAEAEARKGDSLLYSQEKHAQAMKEEMDRLRTELAAVSDERQQLRERVTELDGGLYAAKQRQQEVIAQQKEARIELLRRQVTRRMLNASVSRAWSAWATHCERRAYAVDRLTHAANRLHAPDISHAFYQWGVQAAQAKAEVERQRAEEREVNLRGQAGNLSTQLQVVQVEYEHKLATQQAEHQHAMDRLRAELTGEAEEVRVAREAKEKEARVELLRRQIGRRIMHTSLARGWTAWESFWMAKVDALAALRRVAGRLRLPELAYALAVWGEQMVAQKRAAAAMQRKRKQGKMKEEAGRLKAELARAKADLDSQMATAAAEVLELKSEVVRLGGGAEEAAALAQAQAAKEREARIELLRRQIGRRLLSRDLARGWSAWCEMWAARSYAIKRLRECGNRLRRPGVTSAFDAWIGVWEQARRKKAMFTYKQQAEELRDERARLIDEVGQLRAECEAKLKAAEDTKKLALERQLVELTGSAQEMAALRTEKEREARIELLRRQIGRRLLSRDLARGWSAWCEMWAARSYAIKRLRECGNRLRAPTTSLAFNFWFRDWAEEMAAEQKRQLEKESRSLEAQVRRLRLEHGQLQMKSVADSDEILSLKEKLAMLTEQAVANDEDLKSIGKLRLERDEAVGARRAAVEEAAVQERLRVEAEDDAESHRTKYHELLEQLLAEQRTSFAEERQMLVASYGLGEDARKEVQEEHERERKQAREEIGRLAKEVSELKEELSRKAKEAMKAASENDRLEKELAAKKEEVKAARSPKLKPPSKKSMEAEGKKKGTSVLGMIDLDEGPDAAPITEQIAAALRANAGKVMDLFREWDVDGDGQVSKKEFHRAMPALGLEVPKKEVDSLFDSWDKDGGGTLGYAELRKILAQSPGARGARAKPGGAGRTSPTSRPPPPVQVEGDAPARALSTRDTPKLGGNAAVATLRMMRKDAK